MRRALPEDVEELERLEATLFPDNCMNARTLAIELKHGVCILERNDEGIGAYLLARIDGDLVDIMRVGVLEHYRRAGIASRMLTMALKLAPKAMLMVRKDNMGAIRLYHSFGFQITGEFEESWVMATSSCW
jgi:ribosomal protein S18 acetylase RimI-like enzyme